MAPISREARCSPHPIATFDCAQLLSGRADAVRYAMASIDHQARSIAIEVSMNYRMPSRAARLFGLAARVPEERFSHYAALADAGLARYWSRTITLDGIGYTVAVTARQAADGLPLALSHAGSALLGPLSSRSRNPYPLLQGNLYYEPHYDADADAMFAMTAAHEIGHAFLTNAFGIRWSWGHQGTSSMLGRMAATAPPYPPAGEIDLMPYYCKNPTATIYRGDILQRTIASENDVKTLLYIAGRAA